MPIVGSFLVSLIAALQAAGQHNNTCSVIDLSMVSALVRVVVLSDYEQPDRRVHWRFMDRPNIRPAPRLRLRLIQAQCDVFATITRIVGMLKLKFERSNT